MKNKFCGIQNAGTYSCVVSHEKQSVKIWCRYLEHRSGSDQNTAVHFLATSIDAHAHVKIAIVKLTVRIIHHVRASIDAARKWAAVF